MAGVAGAGRQRYRRSSRIEAAPLQGESILFDPDKRKFFVLNRTAAFIWETLSTPATADEIARGVSQSFDGVEYAAAAKDVESSLDEMLSMALVEQQPAEAG